MDPSADAEPLSFLERPLPPWVHRRVVTIAPGMTDGADPARWTDALVVVECGEVEVQLPGGGRHTFVAGDIVWLGGLAPTSLANVGAVPAVLVALVRLGD
jgi:hypothetical protein